MIPIDLTCPEEMWPHRFSGKVAVGITAVAVGSDESLWIVFDVQEGSLVSSAGVLGTCLDVPEVVVAMDLTVYARADRNTWELLARQNTTLFHEKIEQGLVHIGGDFRTFARYASRLLRMTEATGLWADLDSVLTLVREG